MHYNVSQFMRVGVAIFLATSLLVAGSLPARAQTSVEPQTLGEAVGKGLGSMGACLGADALLSVGGGLAGKAAGYLGGLGKDLLGGAADKARNFVTSKLGSLTNKIPGASAFSLGGVSVPVNVKNFKEITNNDESLRADSAGKDCMRDVFSKIIGDWLASETVRWIEGGGSPRFVTDWKSFAEDAVNVGVGEIINDSNIKFLCSPFQAQIRATFFPVEKFQQRIQCRLAGDNGIIDNIEDFWNDWERGGWVGYTSSWDPQNNYFGVYLQMRDDALVNALKKKDARVAEAVAGKGFLSVTRCLEYGDNILPNGQLGAGRGPCLKEEIVTPGDAVGTLFGSAITSDFQWASNIKSWTSAVVNAAMNRLIQGTISRLQNRDSQGNERGSLSGFSPKVAEGANKGFFTDVSQLALDVNVNNREDALEIINSIRAKEPIVIPLKIQSLNTINAYLQILTNTQGNQSCRSTKFKGFNFIIAETDGGDIQDYLQTQIDDFNAMNAGLDNFAVLFAQSSNAQQISQHLQDFRSFLDLHTAGLSAVLIDDAEQIAKDEARYTYEQFNEVYQKYQQCSNYIAPTYIPPTPPQATSTTPLQPAIKTVRVDTRKVTEFGNYFSTFDDFRGDANQLCQYAGFSQAIPADEGQQFQCKPQDPRQVLDYRLNGTWDSSSYIQGRGFCPGDQYVEWVECVR